MTWLLVAAGVAQAIPAPIHIANTGGEGVFIRPDPNTSRPAVGWIPEGASPDYNCFAWGQNINGVPIWFNVNYNGKTGFYASYFDDSSYHSNEELTAKYGVPLCGSAAPAPAPAPSPAPAPAPAPAPPATAPAAAGGPGSLYFSPYTSNPNGPNSTGQIKINGRFGAWAPSPATITLNADDWNRNRDRVGCPSLDSFVPTGRPAFDGGQITTLAAWSLGRAAPFMFLQKRPDLQTKINYVLLFDPGSVEEWDSSACVKEYPVAGILRNWLIASRDNKLVVLSGVKTADAGHTSVDGHGHAGIQNHLFYPLKRQGEPPGRRLRGQIVVCNYDTMSHENVWINFRWWMNKPPITLGSCPVDPGTGKRPTAWNP